VTARGTGAPLSARTCVTYLADKLQRLADIEYITAVSAICFDNEIVVVANTSHLTIDDRVLFELPPLESGIVFHSRLKTKLFIGSYGFD